MKKVGKTLQELTFLSFAHFLEYADEEFVRSGDYVTYRKEKLREGEMGTIRAISLRDKRPARGGQSKPEEQFSTTGVPMSSGSARTEYGIHVTRNLSLDISLLTT